MKKKTSTKAHNPAALGLTDAQNNAYRILQNRQARGLTTTSSDVAEEWGDKDRSYVYRVLKALCDKGMVERYSRRYYKLTA